MTLYNVEIFLPDFTYKSSCQTSNAPYSSDYLNIEKNKIELTSINAGKGDYIRIKSPEFYACGIVTGVEPKKSITVITYEPFLRMFDNTVYADRSLLSSTTCESWMANVISGLYVTNEDTLQNIVGLTIEVLSGTESAMLNLDKNIINFYQDAVIPAFINYGIVVSFAIDPQRKSILCTIKKNTETEIVIESELPNIINKKIVIKEAKETLNKITVINQDNEAVSATYYRHIDNSISQDETVNRIEPVVYDTVYISVSGTDTFADKAYDKAFNTLTAEEYDNLIELTVIPNDDLVKPYNLQIGQSAAIIYKNVIYRTVLTGVKYESDQIQLVFGAIRLKLTSILKRRLRL